MDLLNNRNKPEDSSTSVKEILKNNGSKQKKSSYFNGAYTTTTMSTMSQYWKAKGSRERKGETKTCHF